MQGDSGGGLFQGNTILGIVSGGLPCQENDAHPDIFTNVAGYITYIEKELYVNWADENDNFLAIAKNFGDELTPSVERLQTLLDYYSRFERIPARLLRDCEKYGIPLPRTVQARHLWAS